VVRRALQTTSGRLVLLLTTVALVLLGSSALAHFAFGEYDGYGGSLWSATLHVLDPSSLHEDEGAAQRTIGVFQVVTGLVLIVGLLFTFLAEVLGKSLAQLGQSDAPYHGADHLVLVGGADMIGVAAMAVADAARRDPNVRRLVVLAAESARDSHAQIRASLRESAGHLRYSLLFGDTAGESGFELACADRARAILLMPASSGPVVAEAADVEVTQSGLALLDYLRERGGSPAVRLLFRRGRNVDASWELFPDDWDAIVSDRTVSGLLRLALTHPDSLGALPTIDERASAAWAEKVAAARARATTEQRPMRLAMVGCGVNAGALMEDLGELGPTRFEVTVIAAGTAFRTYLGAEEKAGLPIRFIEAAQTDPEALREALAQVDPDLVVVTPSPSTWDARTSDANATLATLHVLRIVGRAMPVLAELNLPESASRLPADPRLFSISSLRAVAVAVALSIFDAPAAEKLERQLEADAQAQGAAHPTG
jgi:hypothetical protein